MGGSGREWVGVDGNVWKCVRIGGVGASRWK